MVDRSFLTWPFFEERHRALAERLERWADDHLAGLDHEDIDQACRDLVGRLGADGWLEHAAPPPDDVDARHGVDARHDAGARLDVRTLCLIREILARRDGLADFALPCRGS
ncbi:MAG: hypothetical protein OEU92_28715, partial [Alphaproteobacteria bacterium]|nr:hypothetical protein [Alphaproteobacteria bacterium]